MDYTQTAYFAGAQPYDQFIGIQQPITPAHTNSVASDDYTTSPPEVFEQFSGNLPHGTFPAFGNYVPFNGQPVFTGPPTPPDQQHLSQPVNGVVPPALLNAGPTSLPNKAEADDRNQRQGSNSDEDELTPAQSRRKAQNRAAQRAFRERKDRHLKDVENRLEEVERARQSTISENEKLKRALQKANTEMEILRATSAVAATVGASPGALSAPSMTTGPMSYNPTDFYSEVLQGHANKSPSHRIVTSDDGERLLAAGAAWDLIINHDLYKRGLVDIAHVSERLKSQAKCDGQGPVFGERTILQIIELCVASGSDELM